MHAYKLLQPGSTGILYPNHTPPSTTCINIIFYLYSNLRSKVMPGPVSSSVCVLCVFFPFIEDIKFVGRTSRGHTGGRSHRIFHPPSFCGACLNFSREKDSAIPFPINSRPRSRISCTNDLIVRHSLGIFLFSF